jgi:hypothetical protein
MKKVAVMVLLAGLVAGAAAGPALAQGRRTDFCLNLGVQTNVWSDTSFDNAWFTFDARAGIRLGKSWEIAPELMYAVDDSFDFSVNWLYPGVMLNYKAGGFFIGAGAVLPIVFGGGQSDTGNPAPKINIGYRYKNLVFTLYGVTWTESGLRFLDMNFVGATVGYRF